MDCPACQDWELKQFKLLQQANVPLRCSVHVYAPVLCHLHIMRLLYIWYVPRAENLKGVSCYVAGWLFERN